MYRFGFHRSLALEKLNNVRDRIDNLIKGLTDEDIWKNTTTFSSIDGSLVDLLFEARDELLMLDMEEE